MLYTDSGSPIPNDKPMEQFKALDGDWRSVEKLSEDFGDKVASTIRELRDRVAALEAKRAPEESSAAAPAATVPSDKELIQIWDEGPENLGLSLRVVWDHGYAQGLAAGRAEQGSSQRILDDSTPEPDPEPSDFQTLHGIALDMVDSLRPIVIPEILKVLRQAIREPMAEQQAAQSDPAVTTPEPEPTHPQYFSSYHAIAGEIWGMLPDAPEPNQATAGDGGLVKAVLDAMGEGTEVEARKAICKVAAWARAHDLNGMSPAAMTWEGVARWLEREANQ
ncbi:MAG: hypothetical protein RL519_1119 [Pseudomonadota bacterium]